MTDLILRGGRVIDPASGRDETADIAFGDGSPGRTRLPDASSGIVAAWLSTVLLCIATTFRFGRRGVCTTPGRMH